MRRISRWFWLAVGVAIGYVLGARAGRERYEEILSWGRRTAEDFGVTPAVDQVMTSARDTATEVRDSLADSSSEVLGSGAQTVADTLDAIHPTRTP